MKKNYKYGKLVDNELIYAPNCLLIDNRQVYNATAADYKANGYLPLIRSDAPAPTETSYFTPYYVEENEQIVEKWQENIIPVDTGVTEQDYLEALAKLGVE